MQVRSFPTVSSAMGLRSLRGCALKGCENRSTNPRHIFSFDPVDDGGQGLVFRQIVLGKFWESAYGIECHGLIAVVWCRLKVYLTRPAMRMVEAGLQPTMLDQRIPGALPQATMDMALGQTLVPLQSDPWTEPY